MPSVSRAAGLFIGVGGLLLFLLLTTYRFYTQSAPPDELAAAPRVVARPAAGFVVPQRSHAVVGNFPNPPPSGPAVAEATETDWAANEEAKLSPIVPTANPLNHSTSADLPMLDAPTRLEIPELKLDVKVRFVPFKDNTWDISNLGQDVAWLGSSDGRQSDKSPVLAGHITVRNGNHGPFRYVGRLRAGALIRLHTERHIYTYRVLESFVVEPQDSQVIAGRSNSQLTLVTCVTWDEATKSYLNREIVVAQLVPPETQARALSD